MIILLFLIDRILSTSARISPFPCIRLLAILNPHTVRALAPSVHGQGLQIIQPALECRRGEDLIFIEPERGEVLSAVAVIEHQDQEPSGAGGEVAGQCGSQVFLRGPARGVVEAVPVGVMKRTGRVGGIRRPEKKPPEKKLLHDRSSEANRLFLNKLNASAGYA